MDLIPICGANGSGKTTLGEELSHALQYTFLNDEDYYFLESDVPFSKSRTETEAKAFILEFLKQHPNTVITSTRGNLGEDINRFYSFVIYLAAPLDLRLERIWKRYVKRFGERVAEGGDMYEQQQAFCRFVSSRTTNATEAWLDTLTCPVMRLDGRKPIGDNIRLIVEELKSR